MDFNYGRVVLYYFISVGILFYCFYVFVLIFILYLDRFEEVGEDIFVRWGRVGRIGEGERMGSKYVVWKDYE